MKPRLAGVGFTLVELLVVISVVALLMSILLPVLGRARDTAKGLAVLSAGRQLMMGYSVYQSDHKGHVLYGYVPNAPDTIDGTVPEIVEPITGHVLHGQAVSRYPGRLLPYVGSLWEILQVHAAEAIEKPAPGDSPSQAFIKAYALGTNPTFGLNTVYLGGDRNYGGFLHQGGTLYTPAYGDPRIVFYNHRVRQPSQLVTFATAGSLTMLGATGSAEPGFHRINSPRLAGHAIWTARGDRTQILAGPSDFAVPLGHFDPRPAVAYFDGHLAREPVDRLDDMRRWANSATHDTDDPFN